MVTVKLCFKLSEKVSMAQDADGNPAIAYAAGIVSVPEEPTPEILEQMKEIYRASIATQLDVDKEEITPMTLEEYITETGDEDVFSKFRITEKTTIDFCCECGGDDGSLVNINHKEHGLMTLCSVCLLKYNPDDYQIVELGEDVNVLDPPVENEEDEINIVDVEPGKIINLADYR